MTYNDCGLPTVPPQALTRIFHVVPAVSNLTAQTHEPLHYGIQNAGQKMSEHRPISLERVRNAPDRLQAALGTYAPADPGTALGLHNLLCWISGLTSNYIRWNCVIFWREIWGGQGNQKNRGAVDR